MDGLPVTVDYHERYAHPITLKLDHVPVQEDDVFALGTILYEIFFEEELFHGLDDTQIRCNAAEDKFPDLSAVPFPLRKVINDCWRVREYTASNAMAELSMLWLHLIVHALTDWACRALRSLQLAVYRSEGCCRSSHSSYHFNSVLSIEETLMHPGVVKLDHSG
jgi:hypothetical protein